MVHEILRLPIWGNFIFFSARLKFKKKSQRAASFESRRTGPAHWFHTGMNWFHTGMKPFGNWWNHSGSPQIVCNFFNWLRLWGCCGGLGKSFFWNSSRVWGFSNYCFLIDWGAVVWWQFEDLAILCIWSCEIFFVDWVLGCSYEPIKPLKFFSIISSVCLRPESAILPHVAVLLEQFQITIPEYRSICFCASSTRGKKKP